MKSHVDFWGKTYSDKYKDKIQIADIPVLYEKPITQPNDDSCVSLIYAGLIEKRYRSPSYLLAVLRELDKTLDFEFAFYSKGDCEDEIAMAAGQTKGISRKGYVSPEELENAILRTDFLVSIGNSVSRSLPSKVITYLSYGKPVIHFSPQKDDVCKDYLEKYPLALIIDQTESVSGACTRIFEFVGKTRKCVADFETVHEIFYMNDPAYSAGAISDFLTEERR